MENKKSSKARIIILSIILIIFVFILAGYITNKNFRNLIDIKVLGKQVSENNLDFIEINSEDNPNYFAFDNYIGIISKNKLSKWNIFNNSVAICY